MTIIGTCINCITPGSLSATLALILVGAGIALTAERRKTRSGAFRLGTGLNQRIHGPGPVSFSSCLSNRRMKTNPAQMMGSAISHPMIHRSARYSSTTFL